MLDFERDFSTQGLSIESSSTERVAGTFERRGVTIHFDLQYDGAQHHLLVTGLSGQAIVESTLRDGIDTTVLFGGQARLIGPIDAPAVLEGDSSALASIDSSPEAQLLPELKESLIASHVDEALYRPTSAREPVAGLSARRWFDGTYEHLACGESFGFLSRTFWGTTTVVVAREVDPDGGFAAVWFQAGFAADEYISGTGRQTYRRQWWGAYVTVGNNLLPLCTPGGSWCQNTNMIVAHW